MSATIGWITAAIVAYVTMGVLVGSYVTGRWPPENDDARGLLAGVFWPVCLLGFMALWLAVGWWRLVWQHAAKLGARLGEAARASSEGSPR